MRISREEIKRYKDNLTKNLNIDLDEDDLNETGVIWVFLSYVKNYYHGLSVLKSMLNNNESYHCKLCIEYDDNYIYINKDIDYIEGIYAFQQEKKEKIKNIVNEEKYKMKEGSVTYSNLLFKDEKKVVLFELKYKANNIKQTAHFVYDVYEMDHVLSLADLISE